jgi:hypothetical protein
MSPISIPGKVTLRQSLGADPYYGAVSLLLHGDGADGSTEILDSSVNPKTVTAVGDAQISTTESKWNGSSLKFDGSGDYLQVPANADFDFGSSDWTIEMWVYPISGNAIICSRRSGSGQYTPFWIQWDSTTDDYKVRISLTGSSWFINLADIGTSPGGSWDHIMISRSGSTFYGALNGTVVTLGTDSGSMMSTTRDLYIGGNPEGSLNCYIDDLRITKGVARYTSNFTPPAQPFLAVAS